MRKVDMIVPNTAYKLIVQKLEKKSFLFSEYAASTIKIILQRTDKLIYINTKNNRW